MLTMENLGEIVDKAETSPVAGLNDVKKNEEEDVFGLKKRKRRVYRTRKFWIILGVIVAIIGSSLGVFFATRDCPVEINVEIRGENDYIGIIFTQCPTRRGAPAFLQAVERWSRIIEAGVPSVTVTENFTVCVNSLENPFTFPGGTVFDHLVIVVEPRSIDGQGSALAAAGVCVVDQGTGLPFVGSLLFDVDDISGLIGDGTLEDVVLHEIGHALGIGTRWGAQNLIQDDINTFDITQSNRQPKFVGTSAIREYNEIADEPLTFVPVENGVLRGQFLFEQGGGRGSLGSHWDTDFLGGELLNFRLDNTIDRFLSKVTVASLEDLGYTVDFSQADVFTPIEFPQPGSRSTNLRSQKQGHTIDLSNDVILDEEIIYL